MSDETEALYIAGESAAEPVEGSTSRERIEAALKQVGVAPSKSTAEHAQEFNKSGGDADGEHEPSFDDIDNGGTDESQKQTKTVKWSELLKNEAIRNRRLQEAKRMKSEYDAKLRQISAKEELWNTDRTEYTKRYLSPNLYEDLTRDILNEPEIDDSVEAKLAAMEQRYNQLEQRLIQERNDKLVSQYMSEVNQALADEKYDIVRAWPNAGQLVQDTVGEHYSLYCDQRSPHYNPRVKPLTPQQAVDIVKEFLEDKVERINRARAKPQQPQMAKQQPTRTTPVRKTKTISNQQAAASSGSEELSKEQKKERAVAILNRAGFNSY